MRYVTVRVTPAEGSAFHPVGRALGADPDVTREVIHRVELLADDTAVMLAEARGDQRRYEEILTVSAHVREYAVTGTEDRWYAYVHFDPLETMRAMLRARRESEVAMETPIDVRADGAMEFTLVGDEDGFAEAVPADADACDVEVVGTGERPPEVCDLFGALTSRQREILRSAVALGYYRNPREATQADIGDAVDASASTVGEHLRKIEHRVFSQFTR